MQYLSDLGEIDRQGHSSCSHLSRNKLMVIRALSKGTRIVKKKYMFDINIHHGYDISQIRQVLATSKVRYASCDLYSTTEIHLVGLSMASHICKYGNTLKQNHKDVIQSHISLRYSKFIKTQSCKEHNNYLEGRLTHTNSPYKCVTRITKKYRELAF